MSKPTIQIRQYQPLDHSFVCQIFSNGLLGLDYPEGFDIKPYISESLATDLANIESTYITDIGSNFWVATIEQSIIGMTAIKKIDSATAELRRMSVSEASRRSKVASALLRTAEEFCVDAEYNTIHLTTTNMQIPAIKLYENFGFKEFGRTPHGLITAIHFRKSLVSKLESHRLS